MNCAGTLFHGRSGAKGGRRAPSRRRSRARFAPVTVAWLGVLAQVFWPCASTNGAARGPVAVGLGSATRPPGTDPKYSAPEIRGAIPWVARLAGQAVCFGLATRVGKQPVPPGPSEFRPFLLGRCTKAGDLSRAQSVPAAGPFLGVPEDQEKKIEQGALRGITKMTAVRLAAAEEYFAAKEKDEIVAEQRRGDWVYFATQQGLDVPFDYARAWVLVTHRYRVFLPAVTPDTQPASTRCAAEAWLRTDLRVPIRALWRDGGTAAVEWSLRVTTDEQYNSRWLLRGGDGKEGLLGENLTAMGEVRQVLPSPDGRYLAVVSVGEGHPVVEVVDLPRFVDKGEFKVLWEFDPYPGGVRIAGWEGGQLLVGSDMLMTHRGGHGRVPVRLMMDEEQQFAVSISDGTITARSAGAKDPVGYFSGLLTGKFESQRMMAAEALVVLEARSALPELRKALAAEADADVRAGLRAAIRALEPPRPPQPEAAGGPASQPAVLRSAALDRESALVLAEAVLAHAEATGRMASQALTVRFVISFAQELDSQYPQVLAVTAREQERFERGEFDDAANARRVRELIGSIRQLKSRPPALTRMLIRRFEAGGVGGARLEFTRRLLEAQEPRLYNNAFRPLVPLLPEEMQGDWPDRPATRPSTGPQPHGG